MRSTIIAAATFALGAIATPTFLQKRDCNDTCMTYDQAQTVAGNFKSLIAAYSDADAEAWMTENFQDYSDSVTELINSGCTGPQPLGSVTFASRADFMKGQGSQPPIPFEILNLWYACEGPVVIRWTSAQSPEVVTGNIVVETERNTGAQGATGNEPWLIKTVYSEFNSGSWLVNLGVFKPNCSAGGNGTGPVGKRSLAMNLPVRIL